MIRPVASQCSGRLVLRKEFKAALTVFRALVNRLNGLKRKRNPNRCYLFATCPDFIGVFIFSVSDEFCHGKFQPLFFAISRLIYPKF